jgi:hypothetical protein
MQRLGSSSRGFEARLTTLLCKNLLIAKSKEGENRSNLNFLRKAMAQKVLFRQ